MQELKEDSIIQVNENGPEEWVGCLLQVNEVKKWGVTASIKVPVKGTIYMRLQNEHFEVIGQAIMVLKIKK